MRSFTANFISMFIVDKKRRHDVRRKLKSWNELVMSADTKEMMAKAQQVAVEGIKQNLECAQKYSEQARQYIDVKKKWRRECNGVSPLPGRFAEYDLIFGIGAMCHVDGVLNVYKLRRFASPFDWTGGMEPDFWGGRPNVWRDTHFCEKIEYLCHDFKDYFNPADLKPVSMTVIDQPHHNVVNVRTGIRFTHLFDVNKSLEMQMPEIVEKIERRAKRLLRAIDKSERVLVCWMQGIAELRCRLEAPVSDNDIKNALKKLHKKWPGKHFDLVFFEHDGTKSEYVFDKIEVCPGAYRVRSNHFVIQDAYRFVAHYPINAPWAVATISEMMDNIVLSDKLANIMGEK